MPRHVRPALALAMLTLVSTAAAAQPLGTFRWQLQPYCNIVSVLVTQNGGTYRLEGIDDQCGTGSVNASAIGMAFVNPNGSIGFGLNVVTAPGGAPVHIEATITMATLSGTWRDSAGHSGNFVLTPGAGTGGSPRPAPGGGGGGGTITGVSAGAGLSGGGVSGNVGLSITQFGNGSFNFANFNGFVASGSWGTGTLGLSGPGTRMVWFPGKAAFRAGHVNGTEWDTANSGNYSAAFGQSNQASGDFSFAFGVGNVASGAASTAFGASAAAAGIGSVASGFQSVANGDYSIAMGMRAQANGAGSVVLGSDATTNVAASGSFIFADRSTTTDIVSFAPNEFIVRAAGGIGLYTNAATTSGVEMAPGSGAWQVLSDRNMKRNFTDLSGEDVLAKLARMPVQEWSYTTQDASIRHVGPTAQDFHAAFGLGEHPLRINTVDADGVALVGVKALEERTRALVEENRQLRARLERLERLLAQKF
jgi:hypothetical protein